MRYVALLILLASCAPSPGYVGTTPVDAASTVPGTIHTTATTTSVPLASVPLASVPLVPSSIANSEPTTDDYGRPHWLGTRFLPIDEHGFGEVRPTPQELTGRAFGTVDLLPPPATAGFLSDVVPVPDDVLARSTWHADCPVSRDELAYVTVTHLGFDGASHTGELIVHRSVAERIVDVFAVLFEVRYPIEEMRVVSTPELDLPPTGDGNNTTAFVCRPATGSSHWSQHAYGLAIDINPFHNPYLKGDLVLPELAGYYTDRSLGEVGMIEPGGAVADAFAALGWGWGGDWSSLKDWMHFSQNGR